MCTVYSFHMLYTTLAICHNHCTALLFPVITNIIETEMLTYFFEQLYLLVKIPFCFVVLDKLYCNLYVTCKFRGS